MPNRFPFDPSRVPLATNYRAEHAVEEGCELAGYVFRHPEKDLVIVIYDGEAWRLTRAQTLELVRPKAAATPVSAKSSSIREFSCASHKQHRRPC
jgi:hypothetical protein